MKKKLRAPRPKPYLEALSASSGSSLIRFLASCNASVRYESLRLIQSWLSSSPNQITDDDMVRLWKGLFYCVWHSDKAPAQAQLINRLSSLLLSLDPSLSLKYFSFFLVTLRREWNGIDHLRIDKFYLLIRRFVNVLFRLMESFKWDFVYLKNYVEVLEDKALLCEDKTSGNGVNYHIVSVFLDELKGFSVPLLNKEVVDCLFKPFINVMRSSSDKVLVGKVKSYVFDVLRRMGKGLLERKTNGIDLTDLGKGEAMLGIIALNMKFSLMLYEAGSALDCVQGNRKIIFELHESFLMLENELDTSGIDIVSIAEVVQGVESVDVDEEVVPQLIPINTNQGEEHGLVQVAAESLVEKVGGLKMKTSKSKMKKKAKKMTDKKIKKKEKNGIMEDGVSFDNNVSVESADIMENDNSIDGNGAPDANGTGDPSSFDANGAGDSSNSVGTEVVFNEDVISNLQLQFEKVAAEMAFYKNGAQSHEPPSVISQKKRKRGKNTDKRRNLEALSPVEDGVDAGDKSKDRSLKRVRFAMKNNLIWKPHSPLPPQSLRLPPSVTPRGSALKKGVPPGPVREISPATKKAKLRKGRKKLRTTSPATKWLKKVKVFSV